ncbi:unnamed protein product [Plutella xylostella]|uniref:(diamondback moth) hypothetical protein n=1 Tax=Plutella xylostella TaxID=51655 RepID=A0A8S4FWQ2_PLUXY|nr:unnamed protein product [Plutella xylostella]
MGLSQFEVRVAVSEQPLTAQSECGCHLPLPRTMLRWTRRKRHHNTYVNLYKCGPSVMTRDYEELSPQPAELQELLLDHRARHTTNNHPLLDIGLSQGTPQHSVLGLPHPTTTGYPPKVVSPAGRRASHAAFA